MNLNNKIINLSNEELVDKLDNYSSQEIQLKPGSKEHNQKVICIETIKSEILKRMQEGK